MFKSIIQIAGAIVLTAWTAFGETQNILGAFNNSSNVLKWSPLITLVLLFILMGWAWFDMRKKIEELEDKMPKVTLQNTSDEKWFYDWTYLVSGKPEVEVHGIKIMINLKFVNRGFESTTINASFKDDSGNKFNLNREEQSIPLEGRGTVKETNIGFNYPITTNIPKRGTKITGLLILEVWGDKPITRKIICADGNRTDLIDEVIQQIDRVVK